MTENKRFIEWCTNLKDIENGNALIPNFGVKDNKTGEIINSVKRNLEIMNDLHEEKERWRESWLEEMEDQGMQSNTILELMKENEQLKQRLKEYQQELYCKDRVLEENNIPIECCDKND